VCPPAEVAGAGTDDGELTSEFGGVGQSTSAAYSGSARGAIVVASGLAREKRRASLTRAGYHPPMRIARWDLVLIGAGGALILVATFLHPQEAVRTGAGVVGFALVIAGAYLSLRDFRSSGGSGPDGGGGFWGGSGSGGSHHGGFGGGHGGGGHG
jgi:hypothetical protein